MPGHCYVVTQLDIANVCGTKEEQTFNVVKGRLAYFGIYDLFSRSLKFQVDV